MPLSDAACRAARPRLRPYKLTDGQGLFLLVQPNGSRLWRLAYRFAGKQKTLAFGVYPVVTLGEARERRLIARRKIATGIDPSVEKRALQRPSGTHTFEEVARQWHETRKSGWVAAHADRILSRMERDAFPHIGSRPINEIEAPEILEMIRRVEERGALDVARRLHQVCGQIFRFGIATGRTARDPASDLHGALKSAPKPKHFASLTETQLPEFLYRLDRYDGREQTRLALQFVLLTFVRSKEARFAAWSEFDDLEAETPLWRIPSERMKAGREHLVPLSKQAVAVLSRLRYLAGDSNLVFPGDSKTGTISENTLIFALYRMGYHSRLTVHGFRRLASTILNEEQFNRDWIELQLAHAARDQVRAAYNSAEWLPGRREMMQWWANYLDRMQGSL